MKKRGRPPKEIDLGVMVHMMRNGASLRVVARAVGVNRDTLYSRHWDAIEAGRNAYHQYYLDNREEWYRIRSEEWDRRQLERNCGAVTNTKRLCKFAKVANGRCAVHQGK